MIGFNDGQIIETNVDVIYLGKTNSNIFTLNRELERTSIYNTSDIKHEEIIKIKYNTNE